MGVYEKEVTLKHAVGNKNLLSYFTKEIKKHLHKGEVPIRFVVTKTNEKVYHCDLGYIKGIKKEHLKHYESIFSFRKRKHPPTQEFNAVLMVPTGIGAEIGGHAGDAGPVAKLFGSICDYVITHPNVVNASDINEMPPNGLYVEGSSLTRFLMGTVGLKKVRSNRVLFIMDKHEDEEYCLDSINALNAARATYGLDCSRIIELDPPIALKLLYAKSGRASGVIEHLDGLFEVLDKYKNEYDAVAFATAIKAPIAIHKEYFESDGKMINPWGGVEALFTHAVSLLYNLPSAHSPMPDSDEVLDLFENVRDTIEPRLAAEWISLTFLQCIFKGLQTSPQMITDPEAMKHPGVMTVNDVSCLVIPDGCLGLPVLAALEHGIKVIAVKENKNLMRNDLSLLPWAQGQFFRVENYLEAAGLMSVMKAGIAPESVRRPLLKTPVQVHRYRKGKK